eukprot:COSAG02_NODE_6009_length_3878_cov_2.899974_5_plen_87_part_00
MKAGCPNDRIQSAVISCATPPPWDHGSPLRLVTLVLRVARVHVVVPFALMRSAAALLPPAFAALFAWGRVVPLPLQTPRRIGGGDG